MRYITILLIFFTLIGCGSSSETPKISYKSTFIMFNARKVSNNMQINISVNNNSEFNQSISYSEMHSKDIWWYEDDNITLKYTQDKDLYSSLKISKNREGKYLVCSVGNAKNSTLPLTLPPIDKEEIHMSQAYIKVINTINDDIEKRVYINYESDHSDFTQFNNVSDKFYINASTNSLVYIQYRGNSVPFEFHNSINFDANSAYFIIIYEDINDENRPQIAIVDMTP